LRRKGVAETTIRTYLAHLRSALRWVVNMGMLAAVPKINMPQRAKGMKMMKGRPTTAKEIDRMLGKVEAGLLASPAPKAREKPRRRFSDEAIAKRRGRQADLAAPRRRPGGISCAASGYRDCGSTQR
jgi:hypothetical protein